MPAKDLYHDHVKTALIKDDWTITNDPLRVKWRKNRSVQIDLGAQKVLAAMKGEKKIAVEVKSFINVSDLDALYNAVGQFLVYREALENVEPERDLFLAIRREAYQELFADEAGEKFRARYNIKLLVIDELIEEIVKWIP